MIVYGIDPGIASCGFAALDGAGKLLDVAVITTKRDKRRTGDTQARVVEIVHAIQNHVDNLADGGDTEIAVVEWPVIAGHGSRAGMRGRERSSSLTFAIAGALVGMLRSQVSNLHMPPPQSWRHRLMGHRASGDAVQRHVEHLHGLVARVGKGKAPHAQDAVALAMYGLKMHAVARAEGKAAA